MLPHVRESKTVLDSGFHAVDSGFPGTGFRSLSVGLGIWMPIFRGFADSLSCIPDSKAQDSGFHEKIFPDSGFHKQKFLGFRIPQAKFLRFWIPQAKYSQFLDSRSKNFLGSGFRIPLYGTNYRRQSESH